MSHVPNGLTINAEYKYEDADICSILGLRLQEENLIDGIFTIAPIAERENKLIEFLSDEKRNHEQSPNRTLLIPYLIGCPDDGHWVGVAVKFRENIVHKVDYYDSLLHPVTEKLEAVLMQTYGSDINEGTFKLKFHAIEQNDTFSCGPCMIENLVNAVNQNHRILPSTVEIRQHHIELMNQHYPEQKFNEKQRQNHISFKKPNKNIKPELNTNVESKSNVQLNRIEQKSSSQSEDLNYLRSIKGIAQQSIDIHLNNEEKLCVKLTEIGELADKIKRGESNQTLIRNKHGYRNASAANKKNGKGAKLDFTALGYLKYLTKKSEFKRQLRDTERIKDSLNVLIQKIDYILNDGESVLNDSHDLDLGFLWKIICYYHDLDCLNKLMGCLYRVDEAWFRELRLSDDLSDTINRYALAYIFVELGETAKEFSDFIQPENVDRENLMRGLFCGLKEFRNFPKNNPDVVRFADNGELFQMKIISQTVKSELKTFLSHLQVKLTKTVDLNQYDSFHEFDKPTAKLSAFEKEHEYSIKYIKEIISPIRRNNLTKLVDQIKIQISNCDKILGNSQTNAYEDKIREMALAESKRIKKKLLKYDDSLIYLAHVIDPQQLSSFTEEQKHLILAIKNVMNICQTIDDSTISKLSEDQKSFIKKLCKQAKQHSEHKKITEYQVDTLREHIDKYLKLWMDTPEINENETIDEALQRLIFEVHKLAHSYIKAAEIKVNVCILEKRMLKKVLFGLQKIQKEAKKFKNKHPTHRISTQKGDDPYENILTNVLSAIILNIIAELGLLKAVRIGLRKPECDPFKLILAAKMSLGFIGSLFMNFEKNYKNKSEQKLLLNKSLLLEDTMRAVEVRHSEIMHNTTHSTFDANGMIDVIENCVLPWSTDYIAMFTCVISQPPLAINDFSLALKCIVSIESKNPMIYLVFESLSIEKLPTVSNEIQSLWFALSNMIACNRLLKCNDVIQVYNDSVKPILLIANEPRIVAAIYFEVAMAYQYLRKFEETVTFLELALGKLYEITDYDIHPAKSRIFIYLGFAYRYMRQLSKAKNCYDEAMKHDSALNDTNMIIQLQLEIAALESQLGYHELSKRHNELIFAKYYHTMLKEMTHAAVKVLRRLAYTYFEEFNVKEAEEALNLLDELFKNHRSDIIAIEGQRIVDYEIRILFVQTKYNICKAITMSSEQERNKKLEQIHSTLAEERFNSFPDQNMKVTLDLCLLYTAILLKKPPKDIGAIGNITIDQMVSDIRLELERDLDVMNGWQPESLTAEENYKHKREIYKSKCSIGNCLQKLAQIVYFKNDLDIACALMRRAYLCESLVGFLEFERIESVPIARIGEIDIRQLLFSSANTFDDVVIQYM